MSKFTPGQRVRIVDMPDSGKQFEGQIATVLQMGPFTEPGDVMVRTEIGQSLMLHNHNLRPAE